RARPVARQAHRRPARRPAPGRQRARARRDLHDRAAGLGELRRRGEPARRHGPAHDGGTMTRAPRVLVIDDDPAALQITRIQLQPEGYELALVNSGVAALDRLSDEPPDLVICDLMMPELDGYAVSRALKADPEWRYVPIILLTALDARDAIVQGLEAGAD